MRKTNSGSNDAIANPIDDQISFSLIPNVDKIRKNIINATQNHRCVLIAISFFSLFKIATAFLFFIISHFCKHFKGGGSNLSAILALWAL